MASYIDPHELSTGNRRTNSFPFRIYDYSSGIGAPAERLQFPLFLRLPCEYHGDYRAAVRRGSNAFLIHETWSAGPN